MATTALFAEILVVGLLALPWMVLAISSAAGLQLPTSVDSGWWDGIALAEGLTLAYAAGIIVDRLGDAIFDPWDEAISRSERRARSARPNAAPSYPDRPALRFQLMRSAPAIAMEFLDYARSRRRILRGVATNSVFTLLVGIGELAAGSVAVPRRLLIVLMVVAGTLGIGGVLAWWHIGAMYFQRSLVAYDTYVATSPSGGAAQ
jgi:hypothetical protein